MLEIEQYLDSVLNGQFDPEQRVLINRIVTDVFSDFKIPAEAEYRLAAQKLLKVLYAIDEIMTRSRALRRDWQQISLALRLPSSRYLELTEAQIGRRFGITEMAVSKSVTKLLRLAELKPNGRGYNGMNVREARRHSEQ